MRYNKNLARFEKLKRVLLVPEEFSASDGTLTHTMKVRRRGIEERYRTSDRRYVRQGRRDSGIDSIHPRPYSRRFEDHLVTFCRLRTRTWPTQRQR